MDARAIIAALRDGHGDGPADLAEQLAWFARGLADGAVSDAQAGALAMAVLLKGLDKGARTALTLAMRDSGQTLAWAGGAPVIDKRSTGGVGNSVSLVLARRWRPARRACR